jgi:hypothetical protein
MRKGAHAMWASAVFVLVAIPLQWAGLSSTCTQGADGTFVTGAFLSAPFLVAALVLTIGARLKLTATAVASFAIVSLICVMMGLTASARFGTLEYGSPCGADYAGLFSSSLPARIEIVGAYVVLPLLLAAVALWIALSRTVRRGGRPPLS